jgi:propionyl-CoA carboxylase alpha chain
MITRGQRLFIANRGEIARRIAITARRLGMVTIAPLAAGVKPPSALVPWIDQWTRFEGAGDQPAAYLDVELMTGLAKKSGAALVHPGFGFLSENDRFARAVVEAGMIWVGPHPEAVRLMGSKARAREIARQAQVPILPALEISEAEVSGGELSPSWKKAFAFASEAGFPLLLKATLGGGGKGMRVVRHKEDLIPMAVRAVSESRQAFGEGSLIVEKYLERARHVEVQVMGDRHGGVRVLGDRDCSLQRRHQKILEECPAPHLSDETREILHASAMRLARAVGYDNAGTVEFLFDTENSSVYFLEMNTRLQVEHTVTEEVYGVDLVAAQLQVALGARLPDAMPETLPQGSAVEVRLYAEDPARQFAPAPGRVWWFRHEDLPGVRWEMGLEGGGEISSAFDPMIGKVIARGATRVEALERLSQALDSASLLGVDSNLAWLSEVLRAPVVRQGGFPTSWLSSASLAILDALNTPRGEFSPLAAAIFDGIPESLRGEDLLTEPQPHRLAARIFGGQVSHRAGGAASSPPGMEISQWFDRPQDESGVSVRCVAGSIRSESGVCHPFWYAREMSPRGQAAAVQVGGLVFSREALRNTMTDRGRKVSRDKRVLETELVAPVPGKVLSALARSGQVVVEGETLFVLESMKMEFEVKSSRAGTLGEVFVSSGERVDAGKVLARWV